LEQHAEPLLYELGRFSCATSASTRDRRGLCADETHRRPQRITVNFTARMGNEPRLNDGDTCRRLPCKWWCARRRALVCLDTHSPMQRRLLCNTRWPRGLITSETFVGSVFQKVSSRCGSGGSVLGVGDHRAQVRNVSIPVPLPRSRFWRRARFTVRVRRVDG
jgi:hypothetical protein